MRFNIITDLDNGKHVLSAEIIKVDDYLLYYKNEGETGWFTFPISNIKMISIRDHQNQHPAGI